MHDIIVIPSFVRTEQMVRSCWCGTNRQTDRQTDTQTHTHTPHYCFKSKSQLLYVVWAEGAWNHVLIHKIWWTAVTNTKVVACGGKCIIRCKVVHLISVTELVSYFNSFRYDTFFYKVNFCKQQIHQHEGICGARDRMVQWQVRKETKSEIFIKWCQFLLFYVEMKMGSRKINGLVK
jgi:hypothetical protein